MATTERKSSYTLDELPALLAELERPASPEELRRRHKLAKRVLAHRASLPPLHLNAADLVSEQRESGD